MPKDIWQWTIVVFLTATFFAAVSKSLEPFFKEEAHVVYINKKRYLAYKNELYRHVDVLEVLNIKPEISGEMKDEQ